MSRSIRVSGCRVTRPFNIRQFSCKNCRSRTVVEQTCQFLLVSLFLDLSGASLRTKGKEAKESRSSCHRVIFHLPKFRKLAGEIEEQLYDIWANPILCRRTFAVLFQSLLLQLPFRKIKQELRARSDMGTQRHFGKPFITRSQLEIGKLSDGAIFSSVFGNPNWKVIRFAICSNGFAKFAVPNCSPIRWGM